MPSVGILGVPDRSKYAKVSLLSYYASLDFNIYFTLVFTKNGLLQKGSDLQLLSAMHFSIQILIFSSTLFSWD